MSSRVSWKMPKILLILSKSSASFLSSGSSSRKPLWRCFWLKVQFVYSPCFGFLGWHLGFSFPEVTATKSVLYCWFATEFIVFHFRGVASRGRSWYYPWLWWFCRIGRQSHTGLNLHTSATYGSRRDLRFVRLGICFVIHLDLYACRTYCDDTLV